MQKSFRGIHRKEELSEEKGYLRDTLALQNSNDETSLKKVSNCYLTKYLLYL